MKGDPEPMAAPAAIALSFRDLDFHDNTFIDMKVIPTQSPGDNTGSIIEVQLLQYPEKKQLLRFIGCTNLKVGIDFDVLASNLPPNTSRVDAHTDKNLMAVLMYSQERNWDVGYGMGRNSPLDRKLNLIDELVCFRVQFFGGLVEIIARQYQVESVEQ
jgi:hypothetical protein